MGFFSGVSVSMHIIPGFLPLHFFAMVLPWVMVAHFQSTGSLKLENFMLQMVETCWVSLSSADVDGIGEEKACFSEGTAVVSKVSHNFCQLRCWIGLVGNICTEEIIICKCTLIKGPNS